MKLIISPAKKMRVDWDSLPSRDLPNHLEQTREILAKLRSMTPLELQTLWNCSDKLLQENLKRLEEMNLEQARTPALLAYEGIQYQYMAPGVFTDGELDYVQDHLRILSGFYGVLKPLDGVCPYRLEMQAKLPVGTAADLYGYWTQIIRQELWAETDTILNLASKEYSRCVQPPAGRLITCVFGTVQRGKVVEKGTFCKMARGEMVRYLAQCRGETPEAAKGFQGLGYHFSAEHSTEDTFVFLKEDV